MIRPALLLVGFTAFAPAASAQQTPEALYVSGRFDQIGSISGGEAGVQWLRLADGGKGMEVGAFTVSIAGTRLSYARAGAHTSVGKWTLSGETDLGRGTSGAERFGYARYKAGASVKTTASLAIDADFQYAQMPHGGNQHVWRSGVSWVTRRRAIVKLSYLQSAMKTGISPAVSGRVDVALARATAFGGAVIGTHGSMFGASGVLITAPHEFFAGCQYKVGRVELLGVMNVTRSSVTATRTFAGVRIPITRDQQP